MQDMQSWVLKSWVNKKKKKEKKKCPGLQCQQLSPRLKRAQWGAAGVWFQLFKTWKESTHAWFQTSSHRKEAQSFLSSLTFSIFPHNQVKKWSKTFQNIRLPVAFPAVSTPCVCFRRPLLVYFLSLFTPQLLPPALLSRQGSRRSPNTPI